MTNPVRPAAGFTLIEMIMVITITGIIAGMVAVFIRAPVEGYVDSVRRAELTDQADVALRRMARDVRLALPNSLRPVANGFEFIMTKSGGRYRDPVDGSSDPSPLTPPDCDSSPTPADGPCFLDFTTAANTSFDVLGTMPGMVIGDFIVVYNLGPGFQPADAYRRGLAECDAGPASPGCNIAEVAAINGNTVTLDANPFYYQSPPLPSPSARFQVVAAADKVVRYECTGGVLTRHAGCDFDNTANNCSAAVLAGGTATAAACVIDYVSAAAGRNGLLYISLTLTNSGESVMLFNQIHVDNSP